jgi:hypothetical protein
MAAGVRRDIAGIAGVYRGLSPRTQRVVLALLAVEVVLIAATERDIERLQGDRIRGPKLLWRVIATQNFVGPAAYFGFGRKPRR